MSSNAAFDEQLISTVRENDVIYNKFCKSYKNIALKGEVWKKIATALGTSEHACTTRWKSLRDKYMREKKAVINNPSGSAFHAKPVWHLFNEMEFLSDFVKPRETTGNYMNEVVEEVEDVLHESDYFDFGEMTTSTQVHDDHPSTSNSTAASAPKKKKGMSSIEEHLSGTMTALKTYIETKAQETTTSPNANILQRVDVLLGGLRSTNRDIAEKKIIEYLCKCQIVDLNDGSVQNININ